MLHVELACMRLIEVLFFFGLIGCTGVVVISWISIFRSGFAGKNDAPPPVYPVGSTNSVWPARSAYIQSLCNDLATPTRPHLGK